MEVGKKKVSRTIKLDVDINDRMIALCAHLGVNPNAYLMNEIGKAISRDEVCFKVGKQAADMQTQILSMFEAMAKED